MTTDQTQDLITPLGSDLAERYFVGGLLHQSRATVAAAADVVFCEWIHDTQVKGVYAALVDNARNGLEPDPAGVVPTMLRLGLPKQHAGTASALVVALLTECPLPGNWAYYGVLVANQCLRHRLYDVGQALVEGAYSHPLDRLHMLVEDARQDIEATSPHVMQIVGIAGGLP